MRAKDAAVTASRDPKVRAAAAAVGVAVVVGAGDGRAVRRASRRRRTCR